MMYPSKAMVWDVAYGNIRGQFEMRDSRDTKQRGRGPRRRDNFREDRV